MSINGQTVSLWSFLNVLYVRYNPYEADDESEQTREEKNRKFEPISILNEARALRLIRRAAVDQLNK
jgi:hypothetical protein